MTTTLFVILAFLTVASALMVVINRNPIYSALFLVVTLFCLAGIFLLLEAYFLAVVQIIIYAGAIMVLFLFVIMLLNLEREEKFLSISDPRILLVSFLSLIFAGMMAKFIFGSLSFFQNGAESVGDLGATKNIGLSLFTDYLLPFEIASLLLLVALVGAVLLAKRSLR